LRGGAALNIGARVLALVLGLALLAGVARLGPAVQGAFALFVALEGALVALASGAGLWLARVAAAPAGLAPARLLRTFAVVAAAGGAVALVLFGIAAVSSAPPWQQLWLLALAAPSLLLLPAATGLWLGQGRLVAYNVPQVAAPGLMLVLLAAAAWGGWLDGSAAVPVVLGAWALSRAVVGLGAAGWAWRRAKADHAKARGAAAAAAGRAARAAGGAEGAAGLGAGISPPASPWRFVAAVALANGVAWLNLRATLFVVERVHGLEAAGVYSVAVQLAELLWVLSAGVSAAAYHRLHGDGAARLALSAARWGIALALVAAPLLALAAWWALPVLLGPAYAAARGPLLWLLPGVVVYAGASALSAWFTHGLGRPGWAARIAALSLAVTMGLSFALVPALGATGAAIATSAGYALAMGVALWSFLRAAGLPAAAVWRPAGAGAG
jgi:O-antigen/teichoic acid export membrane protein